MKKWENLTLITLGLENTYSVECYSSERNIDVIKREMKNTLDRITLMFLEVIRDI